MVASIQSSSAAAYTARPDISTQTCGATPEARLLALMVYNQLVQGESAQTSVTVNEQQLKELRETIREALEDAREANEDSGFWADIGNVLNGDIGALAQLVAVAAASIATGGTAALVLGAIAIGCSLASKYADELGIPPKVAIGIGIAAAVASAAGNVGAGAGVVGASGAASGTASAAAGASQVGAGVAETSRLVQVATQVEFYAKVVAGSAQAGGAAANTASGVLAAEALDEQATALDARQDTKLADVNIDDAIDLVAKAIDRQLSAFEGANEISEANQRGNQLIIQNFAGAA